MQSSQRRNSPQFATITREDTTDMADVANTADTAPRIQPLAARTMHRGDGSSSTGRHGSRTLTIAPAVSQEAPPQGILHLRGSGSSSNHNDNGQSPPRVQWAADTVDNEGLGRKKSKVCCIFRKQREFGESDSDESDSCCSSDSDSDAPNAYEYVPAVAKKKSGKCHHDHKHGHKH